MGTEAMPMVKFLAAVCLACCAGVAWAADPAAPDSYIIDFNTDIKGATLVSMAINRSMAPLGADHLHALVKDGFYDGAAFFRVVPDFVVQFGIAGTPGSSGGIDQMAYTKKGDKWINKHYPGTNFIIN